MTGSVTITQAQDSTSTGYSMGRMDLPTPQSIQDLYTYDPITERYIYTKTLGSFTITHPLILTPDEYEELVRKEQMKAYFKEKIDAADGRKEGAEELQKNLLPTFYINSNFFESIFGGNTIEVIPQGSVEMDLGILFSKQDNPAFSPRNRKNLTFDFDQRISLSLLGKVGERLQITANYDTQSTFDFQNQIKLEYTPTEDDIIQKIEVGNVSMPLNSSLIQGAQSLFGVKTELQFGKTTITGVFSEQKSETRSVVAQGGATVTEFDIFALDYDENRHFFLAHYFRDNYDKSLGQYPFINSNVQITRAEVWITNRNNNIENVRNIVALQDIGESNTENIGLQVPPGGFINAASTAYPDNANNDFNPFGIDNSSVQSVLTPAIRDVATVQSGFSGVQVRDGLDYVGLENARKLRQNEYELDTQLGYISLNQRLSNDEILGVSFQFTVNGNVYQVGEFSNDGVDATGGTLNDGTDEQIDGIPQNLVVKLLKSSITNVEEPVWDIMMKNIYPLGAFQLEREDFRLNILYTDPSPLNYISEAAGSVQFPATDLPEDVSNTTLLRVFNLDRLNFNNDPQQEGDGFFDFIDGVTVDSQNGRIIFTTIEPFGSHLFEKLDNTIGGPEDYDIPTTYNANQNKYVFRSLYTSTKTQAEQEDSDKNKFQLKGSYKSTGADGISIGAFNVPQGSVTVTAGGRTLVEGVDYTVNYQLGRVQILDPSLQNSNTPINITTENNTLFGQQTKRFTGLNVEHKFNENFQIGATYLNLNERPLTQKSSYNAEPINNTILGLNTTYSTEVPFLTRLVNKLPNIDTDVESNVSLRGEFAYLIPGAPKVSDFGGKTTVYVDDFEASQTELDISSPQSWFLSSSPYNFGGELVNNPQSLEYNYKRADLSWYTIDPIFYSSQRPSGINDEDLSSPFTRRVFRDEIFPNQDIVQGQTQALFTLDLVYNPRERGPYNFNPAALNDGDQNTLPDPQDNFAGISRQLTTTDFERSNVEFIEFWVMDPYAHDDSQGSGKLFFNLGNISEDILKDGRKQYENGLPDDGSTTNTLPTQWGRVPTSQSLVYAFDTEGQERTNQDVGYDGENDSNEASDPDPTINSIVSQFAGDDPARDNYQYFLQAEGSIVNRYARYNGVEGNSPVELSNTDRGSTSQPDVEDINRDNTMNTIDSYFEYEVDIRNGLTANDPFVAQIKELEVTTEDNNVLPVRWIQFKIPISEPTDVINGAADFRSIRFMRMYVSGFEESTILRFGTLDLVRGDYRRYTQTLDGVDDPSDDDTFFENRSVSIEEDENRSPIPYRLPPGVIREELNNNNNLIRQNEQSLSLRVKGLEPGDARGVYKNYSIDMRQYENLELFVHAEAIDDPSSCQSRIGDGDMTAFIRIGNDLSQNFYEIEIPLNPTDIPFDTSMQGTTDPEEIWPIENRINLPLKLLQEVKSLALGGGLTADPNTGVSYVNQSDDRLSTGYSGPENELRIGIKGNPSFGNVRNIMLGMKNTLTNEDICGEVWFNELRLSELKNQGGWAAVASMDANIADFATVSAAGRRSTIGFGSIEQGPNERSREDVQLYDVVTNLNLGQLLPKKWGIQLPFNYGRSEELITPQYDPEFQDIELETRLDGITDSAEKDKIEEQSVDYTKRQSINFIGVRKDRTGDKKPRMYDVENLTFSYSYNQIDHHDFEIEDAVDKNVRVGATYNYNFTPKTIEPFKKNDSLFNGKYWQFLKDLNFNYAPSNISVSSNIVRQYNEQKFRELNLEAGNIGVPTLYQRNFLFDWQYTINYNLTKSLRFNFDSSNNRIINNYITEEVNPDGSINYDVDNEIGIWDGFFDVGDPNRHAQSLQVNYDLPFNKFPFLKFIRATYSYTGDFQWQDGSELLSNIPNPDENGTPAYFDLGNSIQNARTHRINSNIDMKGFYRYIGLKKIKKNKNASTRKVGDEGTLKPSSEDDGKALATENGKDGAKSANSSNSLSGGQKAMNTLIGIATSIKKIQFNYQENKGIFLPGYTPSIGFIGTLKPTAGFTFGSQSNVRDLAARKGWLTLYPEFNEQYTEVDSRQLDVQANLELLPGLKLDINGNRVFSENFSENYIVEEDIYRALTPNTFGNFNISTLLIKTAFSKSDENGSAAFDDFRANRLVVANRLAQDRGININDPANLDDDGFPIGLGKTSQDVLLPAFLSAYKGSSASSEKKGFLRDIPLPNWDLKYTGLMKLKWFKKRFKRFSIQHGYRAGYTVNQFQTNLDYDANNPNAVDQAGNFKSETILSNVNLTEQFSPLIKIDFEMKNSIKILAELRKDRALSLSFANNLLTEIQGNEIILGLGYRIKDLRIATNLGGKKKVLKSDLNFKLDLSRRDNKTIIRYLDLENNQTTAGQTLYGIQFTADYALSKNLTALFYYDHSFSKYAISTAFPQTTIRSGITLRYNFGN
ncbi:MAG: cell surface protein SprA [Flavobacteriaceae bacterium]|nr:cell surface protein SprA [Flavobacteriaceae bacterium]